MGRIRLLGVVLFFFGVSGKGHEVCDVRGAVGRLKAKVPLLPPQASLQACQMQGRQTPRALMSRWRQWSMAGFRDRKPRSLQRVLNRVPFVPNYMPACRSIVRIATSTNKLWKRRAGRPRSRGVVHGSTSMSIRSPHHHLSFANWCWTSNSLVLHVAGASQERSTTSRLCWRNGILQQRPARRLPKSQ